MEFIMKQFINKYISDLSPVKQEFVEMLFAQFDSIIGDQPMGDEAFLAMRDLMAFIYGRGQ